MTREFDIQFLEISIRTWLGRMDEIFYILHDENAELANDDFSHKEIASEYKREFVFLNDRVYNSCLIYFELKGIPLYINEFKNTYRAIINPQKENTELADMIFTNIYHEEESRVTKIFRQALYPFKAFGSGDEKHLTGLDYLESILKSTSRIVKEIGLLPAKESEVYNAVKIVIESTFPKEGAQFLGGYHPFYKDAKCLCGKV